MRAHYDPWGRRAAPRSVPIDAALALRDQAQQALAALDRCQRDLGATEKEARSLRDALASSRVALDEARREQHALRRALEEAERRAEQATTRAAQAARRAEAAAELEPCRDLDAQMDAAVTSLRADLANVRRHQREAEERARRDGRAELLLPMLDTLDDLRRALDGAAPGVAAGLEAMDRRLVQRIEASGACIVAPEGAFDPAHHEAVGTADGPRDQVMAVVSHGLLDADGAVLRPARVVVGDGRDEGGV